MDRLLCGDVGYGKTEVALRAAFKAVTSGYQVAYLAPTTILAAQHYNTFKQRMKDYPVNIAMLSRFCTGSEEKRVIKELGTGETDKVIGTHKLLGKNVKFNKLGLLIIDEEQRFGVAHKEKLKGEAKGYRRADPIRDADTQDSVYVALGDKGYERDKPAA